MVPTGQKSCLGTTPGAPAAVTLQDKDGCVISRTRSSFQTPSTPLYKASQLSFISDGADAAECQLQHGVCSHDLDGEYHVAGRTRW